MNEPDVEANTDPLINFLRCYIAHDVPDVIAVEALRQARLEHRHAWPIVVHAAYLIRRQDRPWMT